MELLQGESLAARIRRAGRLPLAETVGLARQIASTLAVVHAAGTVHRDLKPDNLFLVPEPDLPLGVRVKILDFGIAKLKTEGTAFTRAGAILGTPAYMAPEQCKGAADIDARADVYSLGCILFEMACGAPPFGKDSFGAIIGAQMYEPPPAPSTKEPAIAPALDRLILAMLAKKPEERPQTMRDVVAALERIVPGPTERTVDTAVGIAATLPSHPPVPRAKSQLGWVLAAVAAGVIGLVLAAVSVYRESREQQVKTFANHGVQFDYPTQAVVAAEQRSWGFYVEIDTVHSPLAMLQRLDATGDPADVLPHLVEDFRDGFAKGKIPYKEGIGLDVRLSIDGAVRSGRRTFFELGGRQLRMDIYVFEDHGLTAVILQTDLDDVAEADKLFNTITESLRFAPK
jgi:hypothetical protein